MVRYEKNSIEWFGMKGGGSLFPESSFSSKFGFELPDMIPWVGMEEEAKAKLMDGCSKEKVG